MEDTDSDISLRPKRRKIDKNGRFAALEKFKNMKGKKNKYDVEEIQNVYDVVDEESYKKMVQEKATDGWLEEDEEGDYIEDGREIFDEDTEVSESKKRKQSSQKKQQNTEAETKNIPKISKFFGRDVAPKKDKKDQSSDVLLDKVLNELSGKSNVPAVQEVKVDVKPIEIQKEVQNVKTTAEQPPILDLDDDAFADDMDVPVQKLPSPKNTTSGMSFKGWQAAANTPNLVNDNNENRETNFVATETLKIWLWDIWEDPIENRGQLFLFGKVETQGSYESICIQIKDVENCIYLLPRTTDLHTGEGVSMRDVYDEFSTDIANKLNITEHKSKQVTKSHAFEVPGVEIPPVNDYLMVCYSGKKNFPPPNKPYKKIAYIFGCDVGATETFILSREIKGPCWISVSDYQKCENNGTWCKLHIKCEDMSSIAVCTDQKAPPPPLSIMSLNLRVSVDDQNRNEIVAISCLINRKFNIDKPAPKCPFQEHFCLLGHPSNKHFPFDFKIKSGQYTETKLFKCDNEIALLNCFLAKIHFYDPDLIVTQDAYARQLDVLCSRIISRKIQTWSKLGKLRLKTKHSNNKKIEDFFIGRMVCDVKSSAEELKTKMRSYDLQSLCTNILKIPETERKDVYIDEIPAFYDSTESLLDLVTLTMQDNFFSMRIMSELNCLPLALQITNIAGNLMGHTLRGGRSERNEYLLLHAFVKLNHIPPEKHRKEKKKSNDGETTATKKKAQYAGGLVLDPIKGFYDKYILLMDFNSLYPSIIQEYNICYTTIDKSLVIPDSNVDMGILPSQIKKLVERRRYVKNLMKSNDLSEELRMQYDIRQMALKLTANSMYGCLGFSQSRFYAPHLAALVTQKGREILTNTKSAVEKQGHQVVYGDTDSIMVLTTNNNYDEVLGIGSNIKQVINKMYKHIELDIDGIFKYLLLLKKKKYAATVLSRGSDGKLKETKEYKGLDIVRRDWCKLAQTAGEKVLDEILSEKQTDDKVSNIHKIMEDIKKQFDHKKVELPLLEITKQLTRAINEYSDIAVLPHVQVALRMNTTMNRNFKKGDIVGYIICHDGTEESHQKRAYHLDELKCNQNLKVDVEYYLANQVFPVISRLVEPIEGIEQMRLAECLGMDPKKYKIHEPIQSSNNEAGEAIIKSNAEKFRFCHKFIFSCYDCQTPNPVAGILRPDKTSPFEKCCNNECSGKPYKFASSIENQLITSIRNDIKRFYENWFICDDPLCNDNTRITTHVTELGKPICSLCEKGVLVRQFSIKDLYNQLCYYKHILTADSLDGNLQNTKIIEDIKQLRDSLLEIVDKYLTESGYFKIKLSVLYMNITPTFNENKKISWAALL